MTYISGAWRCGPVCNGILWYIIFTRRCGRGPSWGTPVVPREKSYTNKLCIYLRETHRHALLRIMSANSKPPGFRQIGPANVVPYPR